jgi:membrane protein
MERVKQGVRRMDAFQQRHLTLSIGLAVSKKMGDDQGGNLAALIAYFGFVCLIPLLMVAVTVLGLVAAHNPSVQTRLLDSALRDFPIIGPQIRGDVHALNGTGAALAFGLLLTLWSGLGVVKAFENAMNTVWNVPLKDRPGFLPSTMRALGMLFALGVVTIASTLVAGVGAGTGNGWITVGGFAVSTVLNVGLFLLAFRILTAADVSWRDVLPGAVVGAVAWTTLDAAGGYYVSHQLRRASEIYGTFAVVIVLLAWLYLGARLTLYAAEFNVVLRERLYPRSMVRIADEEPGRVRGN